MKMRVVDRACAGHRAGAAADGRAVRGARRDHPLQAQQRPARALAVELRKTVVFVTHSVFESVYLSQRIVVMTARPGRVFTELAIDAPYPRDERFRTSAEYAALLPPGVRGAGAMRGGMHRRSRQMAGARMSAAACRALRSALLPIARARARRAGLGPRRARAATAFRPTSCRDRGWCSRRWSPTGALLSDSLLVTLDDHAPGLRAGGGRRRRARGPVQPVAADRIFALSLRRDPAGDADRGDRAAAADLSAAARRRCSPAPGSSRSFRCSPTPRSA